jgi:predicted flap endonuclease-1-like 5' DNA nuclease
MSIDSSLFFRRQAPQASACMTGWQAALQPGGGLRWWGAQFEWPPATDMNAMTDWMMQCWSAPLTLASTSMQAWSGLFSVDAFSQPLQAEVAPAVVVTFNSPAGVPVSIELVEVRVQPATPAVDADVVEVAATVVEDIEATEPVAAASAPAAAATGVSINHCSEAELIALKGIGPALARQIIALRPFKSVDALVDIKGIGPKLLDQLRDQLTL